MLRWQTDMLRIDSLHNHKHTYSKNSRRLIRTHYICYHNRLESHLGCFVHQTVASRLSLSQPYQICGCIACGVCECASRAVAGYFWNTALDSIHPARIYTHTTTEDTANTHITTVRFTDAMVTVRFECVCGNAAGRCNVATAINLIIGLCTTKF